MLRPRLADVPHEGRVGMKQFEMLAIVYERFQQRREETERTMGWSPSRINNQIAVHTRRERVKLTSVLQKSSVKPQNPNALQHALSGHVALPGLAGPHCKEGSMLRKVMNTPKNSPEVAQETDGMGGGFPGETHSVKSTCKSEQPIRRRATE